MRRPSWPSLLAAAACLLAGSPACRDAPSPEPGAAAGGTPDSALTPPSVDKAWVTTYEPELSWGGYNIILYQRRIPALIDMNGRLVHAWPSVRASGRARLLPTGQLAVITDEGSLEELDWDGRVTMTYSPAKKHFLHHDFTPLRNGNYLLLAHGIGRPGYDYLLEIDRSGREVWRWESRDHLGEDAARSRPPARMPHINSVQELPENRWFDAGHEEFRPGNILVSARNFNTLYVVSRPGGRITWRHDQGLDYQHEARMVPAGWIGAGRILLFDNGFNGFYRHRRSSIVELDPVTHEVAWRYESPRFFSSTGGTQQALPNGNVLVTSSLGGRAFEVTRDRRIVWQWEPTYRPMRVARYPYDFCPQLGRRERPAETPVSTADPDAYIDADLYRFALEDSLAQVGPRGEKVTVLSKKRGCEELQLPDQPTLTLTYGIDRSALERPDVARRAHFSATLQVAGEEHELMEAVVDADAFVPSEVRGPIALRQETVSLQRFEGATALLCLALVDEEAKKAAGFFWGPPGIQPASASRATGVGPRSEPLTPEAARLQEEQLKALGYVE